jgi:hypothetical protein
MAFGQPSAERYGPTGENKNSYGHFYIMTTAVLFIQNKIAAAILFHRADGGMREAALFSFFQPL